MKKRLSFSLFENASIRRTLPVSCNLAALFGRILDLITTYVIWQARSVSKDVLIPFFSLHKI